MFYEIDEGNHQLVEELNQRQSVVNSYEDVFKIGINGIMNILKVRVVQPMIQIERPVCWNKERVR